MPEPTIVKITYVYDTLSYETYVEAGSKVVLESDPFYIAGKRIVKYTNGGTTYLAGQLITAPNSDITLTVPSSGGLEDIGHVKIHQGNDVIDVSNTVINIVEKKGKNQPFSYVVLTVLKELFNNLELTLVQKSTVFDIDVYGITGAWTYERLEDNGSTYDITIVNKAYYLKTITLASLLGYTIAGSTITFTGLPNVQAQSIVWSATSTNTSYGTVLFGLVGGSQDLSLTIKRVNTAATGATPEYQYSIIKLSGNPDSIFKFIVTAVTGITSFSISTGSYYSVNPSTSYTISQIENLSSTPISSSQDIFNTISLRLDQYCWNVIETIGLLTNRFAFFYGDYANLKSFPKNYNKNIIVDWEQPSNLTSDDEYRPVLALSANDDQGSQYVLASQRVVCEAFETTVSISNTNSTDVGADIVFASPDNTKIDVSETDNTARDTQARIIALNALKRYYRPGDCVKYSICESTYPQYSSVFSSLSDIPAPSSEGQCVLYRTTLDAQITLNETYFVAKQNGANLVWVEWNTDDVTREPAYAVDTCAQSVEDRQNNITISNVPVALVETEYPACVTTYTWGMPEFMDEQSQFKDLTAVAQEAVLDNTSDTQISSSDASKIVVGNQSISDLKSDRSGFTGLILEKNVDNQVYRLAGYNEGLLQAEFNSSGEIQSGAGNVVINYDGITLHGGVDIDLVDNASKIIANKVILDHTGLNAYTSVVDGQGSGLKVSIGNDGNIVAGSGAVKLGVIPAGNNVNYNFATYNNGVVQCYIDTNGNIVSGGTVTLNSNGLTGYYTTPISSANRSIVVSKTGTIAIGGNHGRTLQITGGQIQFYANGSVINSDGTVTGNLGASIDQNGWITIGDNTVSTAAIVDQAIVEAKLDDDSVSTDKIQALAITTAKIDNLAVTNAKIDGLAVGKIETGTLSANCNIVLSNTGSELLAGPYVAPLVINVVSGASSYTNIPRGTYVTFTTAPNNYKLWPTNGTQTAFPQLIQQSDYEWGYMLPTGSSGGTFAFSFIYVNSSNQEVTYNVSISATASTTGPAYRVRLNKDGLSTYDSAGTQVCSVGADGNISGITVSADKITSGVLSVNSNIYLENNDSAILAGKFTYGGTTRYKVRIDADGLKTYSSTTGLPVCYVDTRGNISGITISANQINTSYLSTNQITLTNTGAIIAGGARFNSEGLTVNYDGRNAGSYVSADALKFYDTYNAWTPYKLYATYDTSSQTATSTVLAESKRSGTTITNPAKLKMVVDGGGATGGYTSFTTNASGTNTNIGNSVLLMTYAALWSGDATGQVVSTHSVAIPATTYCEVYLDLAKQSQSVMIKTPTSANYQSCAFVAYSIYPRYAVFTTTDNYIGYYVNNASSNNVKVLVSSSNKDSLGIIPGTTLAYQGDVFKTYNDNGESSQDVNYVYTTNLPYIVGIGYRVIGGGSGITFEVDNFPINLYLSDGDGAAITLDQSGAVTQGNNAIVGQLYQTGGPVYFKGAGPTIPTYFDMPIVPAGVISQGTISGATIVSRNTTTSALACRNIAILPTGSSTPSSARAGDIILWI